ncbi:sortase [Candidatus Berkelbacteria bacterium]|nr:sortase [Candidatus Berkelbacteria bacterium]
MDYAYGLGAQPAPAPQLGGSVWKTVGVFLLSGLAVYLLLTGPTYWQRVQYWVAHLGTSETPVQVVDVSAEAASLSGAIGAALKQPSFQVASPEPLPAPDGTVSEGPATEIGLSENTLLVPKINVQAPVIWDSSSDEKVMLANLQSGVAHYGFTGLPNEQSGNVFITGHSSYYWWDKGKYKTVFALLDKVSTGDQALIQYQGKVFVYEFRDKVVVDPSQVEVTDPTTEPILSLMTCTPPGTALRRLVVRLKLARVYAAEGGEALTPAPTPSVEPSSNEPVPSPTRLIPPVEREIFELIPGL